MTLNISIINNVVVIGGNVTEFAGDGLEEGKECETKHLIIPSFTSDNQPIKEIGYYAFSSYSNLESITIKPSLEVINPYAFFKCTKLIEINIPITVKYILNNAFDDCYELSKVSIESHSSLVLIGFGAFNTCKKLSTFTIPQSVKELGEQVFTEISGGLTLYYMGKSTFSYISEYDMFRKTSNLKIYVPLNGVSSFCNVPTTKTNILPLITVSSCAPKKKTIINCCYVSSIIIVYI